MTTVLRAIIVVLVLSLAVSASGQQPFIPSQSGNTKNQETSAVGGAATVTLTASAATRVHLYGVTARCSAGSASLTVTDGGTTLWSSDSAFVGTTTKAVAWIPGLTGGRGNVVVVTLGSCGGGNTGVLDVQADIF